MYNIVIWYFYTLQSNQHDKSRCHLSSYKVITIVFTVLATLWISFLWHIHFVTGGLRLWISLTPLTHSPQSPPLWQPLCTTCLSTLCLFTCFSDPTCKWNHTVYVFSDLLFLNVIPARPVYVVANGMIFFFYDWVTFHHMYVPHLLDPFIYW